MKETIQKFLLQINLKSMLMVALILGIYQIAFGGDYYVSNAWTSNGTGYFTLVSYNCHKSTTVRCIEAYDPIPPTGHYYRSQGKYFYPYNSHYQTGYGNPVDCCNLDVDAGHNQSICKGESVQLCATGASHYQWSNGHTGACITVSPNYSKSYTVTGKKNGCSDTDKVSVHVRKAKWDKVKKGNDATCGNCDGSIIVNGDYSDTGKFKVEYTYNGTTVTEGPFTQSGDIILGHLCAGTYSDITIVGVHTGCRAVWAHDITIGGEEDCCPDDISGGMIGLSQDLSQQDTVICVSGAGGLDPFDVFVSGASGANSTWVVTDTFLNILELQMAPPFTVIGKRPRVYLYWNLLYEGDLEGLDIGANLANLEGCFDLSNSVAVTGACCSTAEPITCTDNCTANGGVIEIPAMNDTGTTQTDICINGDPDPVNVTVANESVELNLAWVITDINQNILDLPTAPPFDFSGLGEGVCLIWHIAYRGNLPQLQVGLNLLNLNGCFDLSNPVTVNKTCCDDNGVPISCTEDCEDYTLDFDKHGVDWHKNDKSESYDLGGQIIDIHISNNDHILQLTEEDDSGLKVGINPYNVHDEVVISYKLSEASDHVSFDIVDLDYKTGGSRQQEAVCVYGLLGNGATQILPTITSLDGSVAINGNCAEATANSSAGHDESILVEFTECIDKVIIVYGTGSNSPTHNPDYSSITIGEHLGFSTKVCPDTCESDKHREDVSSIADINVFPNPVRQTSLVTLGIQTDVTGIANVIVMDALGRVANNVSIELTSTINEYQLNTDGLNSGVYFVTLVTKEGRSKAHRLVILGQ